jgi:hypothetical protein
MSAGESLEVGDKPSSFPGRVVRSIDIQEDIEERFVGDLPPTSLDGVFTPGEDLTARVRLDLVSPDRDGEPTKFEEVDFQAPEQTGEQVVTIDFFGDTIRREIVVVPLDSPERDPANPPVDSPEDPTPGDGDGSDGDETDGSDDPPSTPPPSETGRPSIQIPTIRTTRRTFTFFNGIIEFTAITEVSVTQTDVDLPSLSDYGSFRTLDVLLESVSNRVDRLSDDVETALDQIDELAAQLQGINLQDIRRGLDQFRDRLSREIQDIRRVVDSRVQALQRAIDTAVADLQAEITAEVTDLQRLSESVIARIQRQVNQLRSDLLPEALDGQQLSDRIVGEVAGLLPQQFDSAGEAFGFLGDLSASDGLRAFISDPAGYVLDAVLSEAERRLDETLLPRLKSLTDAALDVALESETKERLRDQADE